MNNRKSGLLRTSAHCQQASNQQVQSLDLGRRRFIRTTAGGLVIAAATPTLLSGCSSMPTTQDSAFSAWSREEEFNDIRLWALSHAILAPNPHNLQPWLVDLSTNNEVLIAIDPDRVLPATDPVGRQIMIGTGAMVGLLELAALQRGYAVTVEWIGDPSSDSSGNMNTMVELGTPILRATFSKPANTESTSANLTNEYSALFAQIRNRHTVRDNYDLLRSPAAEFTDNLAQLKSTSQSLGVIDKDNHAMDFEKTADWVKRGWEIEMRTPNTMMESMRLLRIGKREIEKYRDGIVIDNPFVVALERLGMMDRSKPVEPGSRNYNKQIATFNEAVDSTPAWFWLTSNDNLRMSQVECGKTFVKVQLNATEHGMVMHPVSQGLQEYKEMDEIYQAMQAHFSSLAQEQGQTLQMLARVGYLPAGSKPPKPSPRRGMDAHVVESF